MIPQLMQHPLLVRDEEVDLARRARAGDDSARRRLAESNLRLVCNIAKKYQAAGISHEDLVQEGSIGLMRAIDRYDPEMGWKFSTYAVFWIRQAIGKALAHRSRVIRLPAHILEASKRTHRLRNDLTAKIGRAPTNEELAGALGISLDKLATIDGVQFECVSLETGRDDAWDYTTVLPDSNCDDPEGATIQKIGNEELHKLLDRLPARERIVLSKRMGLGGEMSIAMLDDLARLLNVSRDRVRQIEARAIRTLRQMIADGDEIALGID